jgi:hypothetical protein
MPIEYVQCLEHTKTILRYVGNLNKKRLISLIFFQLKSVIFHRCHAVLRLSDAKKSICPIELELGEQQSVIIA